MRISDWSSDVCSSDLIDESQPLGAVDNLGGQLDERLRIALEIRQPAALGQDGDETAPRELGAILKISQHVGQDDIALLDGYGAGRGGFGCEHAALPDGQSSDERRVGKAGVSTCSTRRCPHHNNNSETV